MSGVCRAVVQRIHASNVVVCKCRPMVVSQQATDAVAVFIGFLRFFRGKIITANTTMSVQHQVRLGFLI